jgi:glycosyltransferase involved in cell wall biosynthesis
LKILFFIDALGAGGKERRLNELLKKLSSVPGIDFELVLMSKEIHYKNILESNIRIHFLIRNSKKDLSVFRKFYKICKKYKPDIIHCWNSMAAIYSVPAAKLLGIKLINGMVVDTPVKQNITNKSWLRARLTFPFSDIVIGNSHAGLEAYKAPVNKSFCIYNGIDFTRFEKLKDPLFVRKEIFGEASAELFIAGMVAAFEDRKDYATLIKAAINLVGQNNSIRFILVGDGANFIKIKNSVPGHLLNKIIFLGKRSDVESIGNLFDVGILLTDTKYHGEGISNSIIEYMALDKPVIATRGGGTAEVVIDGINGFLIDPHNYEQLTEKIKTLFIQKERRCEMGKAGRQMAIEKFDLKTMANHYVETYHRLLKTTNKQ